MYLLGSPAFGVLEGKYKDIRDHSEVILQVLRKSHVLSMMFYFEKGLVAAFFFCF